MADFLVLVVVADVVVVAVAEVVVEDFVVVVVVVSQSVHAALSILHKSVDRCCLLFNK